MSSVPEINERIIITQRTTHPAEYATNSRFLQLIFVTAGRRITHISRSLNLRDESSTVKELLMTFNNSPIKREHSINHMKGALAE
jgi:hypothetical protein